ncbi:MAG: hypothetical protein K2I96_14500 [Lachnospiraceae bacterium]|nr:hypothetical protein [Lachnospiraceae bacterium]
MTLQKVPFKEWDALLGYRTIQDVVETLYHPVLFNDPINVPDDEKELFIHHKPTSPYRAAYEDVLDNFVAMGEFNYELYFAMPYFVDIYKMWQQKQDYQLQFLFLNLIGVCLSTDFPYNHFSRHLNENLPKEIIENHLRSIEVIREEAKTFISEHLARLRQLTLIESQNFCQCLFAILGDREASYVHFMGNFNSCYIACPHCTDPEEDFGINYYFDWYV